MPVNRMREVGELTSKNEEEENAVIVKVLPNKLEQ
jgi:hypothetical protein